MVLRTMTCMGLIIWLSACHHKPAAQDVEFASSADRATTELMLQKLVGMMTGHFESHDQAQKDQRYFHISLKMTPIWQQRNTGHWLYVEQAVASRPEQPYRQRIYHVTAGEDGQFISAVYELPNPEAVVGGFENPALLDDVSINELTLRTGCEVVLKASGSERFEGATDEKRCLSQLRGASYATSQVVITADRISSWDQGFDANDQQVWGAEAGPYVFDRVAEQ